MTLCAAESRARSGSAPPEPRVRGFEDAVGERFADEIARGAAWFQQDADGWGVTALVDRPRPAAFSCDQDLVLRQAMADRGWAAPQFVERADTPAAAVELPRHSIVGALGGAVDEPEPRRVWHVSSVGLAPVAPRPVVTRAGAVEHVVRSVVRAAGVQLAVGGSVDVSPSVAGRGLTCVVSHPVRGSGDGIRWASSLLRAVVSALASSRLVGQVVQLSAFERFVLRAMRRGGGPGGALGEAYRAVAVALARRCSLALAPGSGDRLLYEPRTRTLVVEAGPPGVRRSLETLFRVAEVAGDRVLEAAAARRDPVALLRAAGVGGPVSHPEWSEGGWHPRAEVVTAVAAKRVAERLGLPFVAGSFSPEFAAGAARVLDSEGWRSVLIEAGNLAGWLVDGVRGRPMWPAALE